MKIQDVFIGFVTSLIFVTVSAVLNGLVLLVLWGWFVVPIFELSALTMPKAIAIALILGFLTDQYFPVLTKKKLEMYLERLVFIPLAFLFSGWILHFFV